MLELRNIDLHTDPDAARYVKNEQVQVTFAGSAGEMIGLGLMAVPYFVDF